MRDKGIVINQPSVLAYEKKTRKIVAVGNKAKRMLGKTTEQYIVTKPIRKGVISEYVLAEHMIKAFVKNALKKRKLWGRPNVCVVVPQNISEVEKRAVESAIMRTGAKEMFLLESPVAAALGSGVDIMENKGHLVVDIGGGTTEIAVISSGDIHYGISLKIGGEDYTDALSRYVRRKYNIELGELSAEDSKMEVGSVYKREEDVTYDIKGKNLVNGLPVTMELSANDSMEAYEELNKQIIDGILKVLDKSDPDLVSDVSEEGILLTGGGSLIYGMDKLLSEKTGMDITMSYEPENEGARSLYLKAGFVERLDLHKEDMEIPAVLKL